MNRLLKSLSVRNSSPVPAKDRRYVAGIGLVVAALAISAIANRVAAKRAERNNPPKGRFVEVDGARLHYLDQGADEPLVLLHGNGTMIQDFETSGLIKLASENHRVIAFDRPGFGHSSRPRTTIWTPEAQADLIHQALNRIGIKQAKVVGHSWGASVALALALRHPDAVSGLALVSGYYYPTARTDFVLMSGPSVPFLGDILSYTVSPIISRLIWPLLMRKMFGPHGVPTKFKYFPKEMAMRPSQIRASAAKSALMIPGAFALRDEYERLKVPVVIIAGEEDRVVNIDKQSARLHKEIERSNREAPEQ